MVTYVKGKTKKHKHAQQLKNDNKVPIKSNFFFFDR
jgi:hypothetical protein